ncbi:hypothetical protein AFV7_gp50 [Betalipothrixvirus pezzuloense]|uniref:Uncharacterized protein n=1 Tax=Betalipothrixvirus pezzuloense TaxID=346883 RepID=A7WKR7_9VIRU|nr:hypothetical protein AFV7_gp50 [Acidianus filamentous virus 7]CAJ31670.1 conserved hypothetical protein [Acidianus filamentous virus 7]
MTVSREYIALLQQILTVGYKPRYYYYSGASFTFNYPTGIMIVAKQGEAVVAQSLASISSIVENDGELSVTFQTTFSESFSADELDLYAVIGTTVLYKIAYITGSFQSSTESVLHVEWTIDVTVNNVFNVPAPNGLQTITLPTKGCPNLSGQIIIYPYLVHLIIALTLIPSIAYVVQSQFPNIPLANMVANVPIPPTPQGLNGITAFAYMCNGEIVGCYPVQNGIGIAVITSTSNCSSVSMIVFYQLQNTYIAYMTTPITVQFVTGKTYSYEIGINVTTE